MNTRLLRVALVSITASPLLAAPLPSPVARQGSTTEICVTAGVVPSQVTNWLETLTFDRFDPSLGTLVGVTLRLDATTSGSTGVENLQPSPAAVTIQYGSLVTVARTDSTTLLSSASMTTFTPTLSAFDGTIDFAGASGAFFADVFLETSQTQLFTAPGDLALFTGPGTVDLDVSAVGTTTFTGAAGPITFNEIRARAALTVCYEYVPVADGEATLPTDQVNWIRPVLLPPFDPSLGNLERVVLLLNATVEGTVGVESPDVGPLTATSNFSANVDLLRLDSSLIARSQPGVTYVDELSAYDGTIDFDGPSGVLHSGVFAGALEIVQLDDPADLALFTGFVPVQLTLTAMGTSTVTGPGGLVFLNLQTAGATVSVTYEFSPGTPVCFGVGCPCGNDDPSAGCANSTGSGARLEGTGSRSVALDDLGLVATGCPPNNSGLYFAGTTLFPMPVNVGDGFGCAGGGSHRYLPATVDASGTFTKSGLVSTAPPGFITPGVTRWFQAWTRDVLCGPPPSPCPSPCGNGNNLSNAYRVTFAP